MKLYLTAAALLLLSSCAGTGRRASLPPSFDILEVKREIREYIIDGSLRARKGGTHFAGRGNVDKFRYADIMLEPDQRGEEYIVRWKCKASKRLADPVVLRFEYVYTNAEPPSTTEKVYRELKPGKFIYFWHNIGDDYVKNGRVVSWKCSLLYRGEEVDHIQSPLWQ